MKRYLGSCGRRAILSGINALSTPTGYESPVTRSVKAFFLRRLGVVFGSDLELQSRLFLYRGKNIRLGSGVVIGYNTQLWDYFPIFIGDRFLGSKNLVVISGTHSTDDYRNLPGPVFIGKGVWVGINVTICGPVTIGDNVIIAAGSVVVKDIPSNCIAGGVPAKVLKLRTP
jgi:maltose O-acetyltransferase